LEKSESIHLALMPEPDGAAIDRDLERRMERAEKIVILVRAMRMKANLKVRQPLQRIILPIAGNEERAEVQSISDIIREEVNVKAVEFVTDESGLVRRKAKPNFRSLGPKFGKGVQSVAARIKDLTAAEIGLLEQEGTLRISAGGNEWSIGREDVEILREEIQGWVVESDGDVTVALDTQLTEELVAEGNAREFVNRLQNLRKEAGFEVTDRIAIHFSASPVMSQTLHRMKAYIAAETLAVQFDDGFTDGEHAATVEVNGEEIRVRIERRAE
jgi:isoleucyl-tRNA synthetase